MKPEVAFSLLQKQELIKKFVEIGKVHLTWAILKNVDMVVQRVVFLHEELMKLPSFPRKALEADLDLHQGGEFGKVRLVYLTDFSHKFSQTGTVRIGCAAQVHVGSLDRENV